MIFFLDQNLYRIFLENRRRMHETAKELRRERLKKKVEAITTRTPSNVNMPSAVRWAKVISQESGYLTADFYTLNGQNNWVVYQQNVNVYPQPDLTASDYEINSYYPCVWTKYRWTLLKLSGGGTASFAWALIAQQPEYDTSKDYYLVKRATVSNGQWIPDGSDEITVKRALGYEGYSDDEAKDIRNWVPWWPVNSIVRIIERWDGVDNQMRWFIAEPMIYTGKPETATLRHHPTDGIVQCVWQ